MAHHDEQTSGIVHEFGMTPLTWWLAALAGSGLTLMIVAAGIGVITGEGVGILFALGLLMLIGGGGAWIGVERPFENFDDINQPLDGGHGHSAEADHSVETAHTEDTHAPAHHYMVVIPPRAPVGDPFSGVLSRLGGRFVLSLQPPDGAEIVARGVLLRYGARLLEKPFVSIVPGLIALERGEMMTGETAWDFLFKRSNLFPRAEVYGTRDDGHDDMATVKRFDLALAPKVLAYADDAATVPLAEVSALLGTAGDFPARAVEYLGLS